MPLYEISMKLTVLISALLVSVVCINVPAFAAEGVGRKTECKQYDEGIYTYLDLLLDLSRLEAQEEYEDMLEISSKKESAGSVVAVPKLSGEVSDEDEVVTPQIAKQKAAKMAESGLSGADIRKAFARGVAISKESARKTLAENAGALKTIVEGRTAAGISDFRGRDIILKSESDNFSFEEMKNLLVDGEVEDFILTGYDGKRGHFVTYIKVDKDVYRFYSDAPGVWSSIKAKDVSPQNSENKLIIVNGVFALTNELEKKKLLDILKFAEGKDYELRKISPGECAELGEDTCEAGGLAIKVLTTAVARYRYYFFKTLFENIANIPSKIIVSEAPDGAVLKAKLNDLFKWDMATANKLMEVVVGKTNVHAGGFVDSEATPARKTGTVIYENFFAKLEMQNNIGTQNTEIYEVIQPLKTEADCEEAADQCDPARPLCTAVCCPLSTHVCVKKRGEDFEIGTKVYCVNGNRWVDCTEQETGGLVNLPDGKGMCVRKRDKAEPAILPRS